MLFRLCGLSALLIACAGYAADAPDQSQSVNHAYVYTPPHVSAGWRSLFGSFRPFWNVPGPHDLDGWREWDESKQAAFIERDAPLIQEHGATLRDLDVDGVRVVEITPRNIRFEDKALIYMHGGGWASFSPESTLIDTVPMADQLGIRIYAVDYTKAPFASLYDIIDENVAVFRHMIGELDFEPRDIGLYGCSAGGHLALAVSNASRNRGIGVPGAVVAGSPMIDFTMTNDTWITLEGQDPVIAREAYVRKLVQVLGIDNLRDPIIAPQFDENLGDGMPPILIQTGGKEILLSDSLVMFQALEAAGQIAKLDLYDGMPHCFPFILPESPEAKTAYAKQAAWFRRHLELN